MKNKAVGLLIIVLGGSLFSIELYGLKIVHILDRMSGFPFLRKPSDYLFDPTILISLLISACIVVLGVIVIVSNKSKGDS